MGKVYELSTPVTLSRFDRVRFFKIEVDLEREEVRASWRRLSPNGAVAGTGTASIPMRTWDTFIANTGILAGDTFDEKIHTATAVRQFLPNVPAGGTTSDL